MSQFSTPNTVPSKLAKMLLRLEKQISDGDAESVQEDAMVTVFVAVALIESFAYIYFRIVADEPEFAHAREKILEDLNSKWGGARHRIRSWVKCSFKKDLNESDPRWEQYKELLEVRNQLTHFKSTHETINLQDVKLVGMVGMAPFQQLKEKVPTWALDVAIGVIRLIAECRGIEADHLDDFVHGWLGLPPELQ